MTWNLWWRFGPRWRERQPGILATIERFTPDLVGLQEVWGVEGRTQADELAESLGFHAAFAAPSYPVAPDPPVVEDHAGVELGVALLSRWPILRQRAVVMPARHRAWDPVILSAVVAHPAGPLLPSKSMSRCGPRPQVHLGNTGESATAWQSRQ
jgi:endonuclease/exonuclease/phosphatase family metal-dependent hydrolase